VSVVADLATKTIYGKGPDGYREALALLVEKGKEPA
jgi:3-dehydroquinate dehydratase